MWPKYSTLYIFKLWKSNYFPLLKTFTKTFTAKAIHFSSLEKKNIQIILPLRTWHHKPLKITLFLTIAKIKKKLKRDFRYIL